jgi:hypothetical protein
MKQVILFIATVIIITGCSRKPIIKGFSFVEHKDEKKVDLLWNGQLLTAYCYFDSIRKPILFPVNTITGITVTRGYPIEPREGESTDHPHHTGVWMNYESVNGLDFWNNSTSIPVEKRDHYGTIFHTSVKPILAKKDTAVLEAFATWQTPSKEILLNEHSQFHFSIKDSIFFIDRVSTLTAEKDVVFKDVKDGFFAIRVAKGLEMHIDNVQPEVGAMCSQDMVEKLSYENYTALYENSGGVQGDSVWSSQGTWVILRGILQNKNISVGIIDHPLNPGYPAYWHARGYGLFAVNPLGRKVFSNGKEELNLSLKKGESIQFQYRLLVGGSKPVSSEAMDSITNKFAQRKFNL